MNTIRYVLFYESAELSDRQFNYHQGDIISALFEKDRSSGTIIDTYSSRDDALAALAKYRCTAIEMTSFGGIPFYYCDYYYIQKKFYDDFRCEFLPSDDAEEYAEIDETVYMYLRGDDYED